MRAFLLSLLALCAVAVAGCANAGATPDLALLIGSSIRAAGDQKDLKVHYDVTAKVDGKPSAAASEQTRKLLSSPLTLKASGGASKEALTVAGEIGLSGTSHRAEVRVGPHETYVSVLGSWYGDRTKGLRDASTPTASPRGR